MDPKVLDNVHSVLWTEAWDLGAQGSPADAGRLRQPALTGRTHSRAAGHHQLGWSAAPGHIRWMLCCSVAVQGLWVLLLVPRVLRGWALRMGRQLLKTLLGNQGSFFNRIHGVMMRISHEQSSSAG